MAKRGRKPKNQPKEDKKKPSSGLKEISTVEEAAEYIGYSTVTLHTRINEGFIRYNKNGSFNKHDLDREKRRINKKEDEKEEKENLKNADLRYRLARAEKEELVVAQLKGRLFDVAQIEKLFTDRAYFFAGALKTFAHRTSHKIMALKEITDKEIVNIQTNECQNILRELTQKLKLKIDEV